MCVWTFILDVCAGYRLSNQNVGCLFGRLSWTFVLDVVYQMEMLDIYLERRYLRQMLFTSFDRGKFPFFGSFDRGKLRIYISLLFIIYTSLFIYTTRPKSLSHLAEMWI